MRFKGKYVVGKGRGAFFVSMPKYMKQFQEKLGFEPFPGTFNIKVDQSSAAQIRSLLKSKKPILIEAFEKHGSGLCYPAKVEEIDCYLVFPDKTTHSPQIFEFLAPVELRKLLKISPGALIKFNI